VKFFIKLIFLNWNLICCCDFHILLWIALSSANQQCDIQKYLGKFECQSRSYSPMQRKQAMQKCNDGENQFGLLWPWRSCHHVLLSCQWPLDWASKPWPLHIVCMTCMKDVVYEKHSYQNNKEDWVILLIKVIILEPSI